MTSDIIQEFNNDMNEIYRRAKKECRYNATYFLRMLSNNGGIDTAKILLSSGDPQYGFEKLWECGRLDLTVEALVIKPKYVSLFTEQEIKAAVKRLKEYGY
ncbi:MAG: hypothetical protein Q8O55_09095 [Dehalococcoidales bacterium]|nr:hypothetical protein [Dehalococcoidales bacterium]